MTSEMERATRLMDRRGLRYRAECWRLFDALATVGMLAAMYLEGVRDRQRGTGDWRGKAPQWAAAGYFTCWTPGTFKSDRDRPWFVHEMGGWAIPDEPIAINNQRPPGHSDDGAA